TLIVAVRVPRLPVVPSSQEMPVRFQPVAAPSATVYEPGLTLSNSLVAVVGSPLSTRLNVPGLSTCAESEPDAVKPKLCGSFGWASLTILIVPQVLSLPKTMSFCSAVGESDERVSAITDVKHVSPSSS